MLTNSIDQLTMEHLEGLSGHGVIWVQLSHGSKHSLRGWDHYENLHHHHEGSSVDVAVEILRRGHGLGYLVRGDLWVLDLDTVPGTTCLPMLDRFEDVCSARYLAPPRIQTPSMGIHAIFMKPPALARMPLKNHVCHPLEDEEKQEWDFKFGPRTLMVAPGTTNDRGISRPITPWMDPPVLDPRILAPQIDLFKDQRPFLIDNRTLRSRIIAGYHYLTRYAPISREGYGGHHALHEVAVMLVVYRDLDPELALFMLTHAAPGQSSWNGRCVGVDGNPYPWSHHELRRALSDALDDVPSLGIKDYESKTAEHEFRWLMASFVNILRFILPHTGTPAMTATELFHAFNKMFGLSLPLGWRAILGRELTLAMDQGEFSLRKAGRKGINHYIGVNPDLLDAAQARYEEQQHLVAVADMSA